MTIAKCLEILQMYISGLARDSHSHLCLSLWPLYTRVSNFSEPGIMVMMYRIISTIERIPVVFSNIL